MDALQTDQHQPLLESSQSAFLAWEARLDLSFAKRHHRTYLAKNRHLGPLVLQKALYPEGESVCHGVVVHPPGGVAGGDALTVNVSLAQGTHALLTTPGAGKWYKANGKPASQHLAFDVQQGASLEWLPQENILFNGADVKLSATVQLEAESTYAGWEILCFGRQAQKEQWQMGGLHQHLRISRQQQLIWHEAGSLKPDDRVMQSLVGFNGNAVSASFLVAAGQVPVEVLAACRAVKPHALLDSGARVGVTALPEVFCARYIGQSSQSARQYFELLWHILRPWYAGRSVTRPRIWST